MSNAEVLKQYIDSGLVAVLYAGLAGFIHLIKMR